MRVNAIHRTCSTILKFEAKEHFNMYYQFRTHCRERENILDHILKMDTPRVHFHYCKGTPNLQKPMSFFNYLDLYKANGYRQLVSQSLTIGTFSMMINDQEKTVFVKCQKNNHKGIHVSRTKATRDRVVLSDQPISHTEHPDLGWVKV